MEERPDLRGMTRDELAELVSSLGEPSYRAGQIYRWLHPATGGGITDISEMTDLPAGLRSTLSGSCLVTTLEPLRVLISADGTRKYLFRLGDGNVIETVYMRYSFGVSICVSSQAGCARGCSFCASTLGGVARSLTAAEVMEQVSAVERDVREKASHIVIMGSGEPFDNYDEILRFIHIMTDEQGRRLGARHITLSTCGVIPGIRRFTAESLQVGLAVSLHAPRQDMREKLMPVAREYPLDELMEALDDYFSKTGRQVTFEYALMNGVNDSHEAAVELAGLLSGRRRMALVNLIPVNPVRERGYATSTRAAVRAFQKELENRGIHATIRRELGGDIDGACGQLRYHYMQEESD